MSLAADALVRFRLEAPAVLTRGDRFIIRAYSPPVTIGGGLVLDAAPTRPGIRTAEGEAALERLRFTTDGYAALAAMIDAAGLAGIAPASLIARGGLRAGKTAGRHGSSRAHEAWSALVIGWSAPVMSPTRRSG